MPHVSVEKLYDPELENVVGRLFDKYRFYEKETAQQLSQFMHEAADKMEIQYKDLLKLVAQDYERELKKISRYSDWAFNPIDYEFGWNNVVRARENPEFSKKLQQDLKGKRVIDLGCGRVIQNLKINGFIEFLFKNCHVSEYTGVDPTLFALESYGKRVDSLISESEKSLGGRINLVKEDGLSYLADVSDDSAIITSNGVLCEVMYGDVVKVTKNRDIRSNPKAMSAIFYEIGLIEQIHRVVPQGGIFFGTNVSHDYPDMLEQAGFRLENAGSSYEATIMRKPLRMEAVDNVE